MLLTLQLEQLTLDRDLVHLRDRLAPEVAEMVYYGFWYVPKMDALLEFIRETQNPVTGEITLGLYKGNIEVHGRKAAGRPLRCGSRKHGRRRQLRPNRRRRLLASDGPPQAVSKVRYVRGNIESGWNRTRMTRIGRIRTDQLKLGLYQCCIVRLLSR